MESILGKRLFGIVTLILATFAPVVANAADPVPDNLTVKVTAYDKYYRFIDDYGDERIMVLLKEVTVFPPMKFKNKQQEEFYWRLVRDVRKTLPYAKLAYSTLCETYQYIQTIPDKKQRESHLSHLEKDIFEQYKPVVKKMTKTQGRVMLKLINRETSQSSFNIVKAFLGSFRAGFWQTFGRFFGINMKVDYKPDRNDEDKMIERIATLIEQGGL